MNRRRWVVSVVIMMILSICRPITLVSIAASDLPTSLELVTEPLQKEYCVGDKFNERGLSLLVSYSSGNTKIINAGNNNLSYDYDFSNAGTCTVKISYTETEKTISLDFNVKVYERPVLSSENVFVVKGQVFHIPIQISKNCGVMGIQLQVSYDSDCFIPLSVGNNGILNSETVNDSVSTSDVGSYKIVWGGSENITSDGELFDLEFLCKEDMDKKECNIEVSSVGTGTYNEGYNTITFEKTTCTIGITDSGVKTKLNNLAVFMEDIEEGTELGNPSVVGNDGEGKYTILYSDKVDGTFSGEKPSKAGTYYLKIIVEETEKYESGSAICSFKINEKNTEEKAGTKKTLKEFAVILKGWEIGSEPSTPSVLGNLGNGNVTFTYAKQENGEYSSSIPNEVGTYFIKATVDETGEYYGAVAIGTFLITPKIENSTVPSDYDGNYSEFSNPNDNSVAPSNQTSTNSAQQQELNTGTTNNPGTKQTSGKNGSENNGQSSVVQQIQPGVTSNTKVTGFKAVKKKKAVVVNWKKLSEASGYEVQISTKKKFKTVTSYNVKSTKNKLEIKKLKSNKKYYIRIRAYQTYKDASGVDRNSYGKWVAISKKTK